MKISLITYHKADNYGATMQAYATYKVLQELGFDVEFIDLDIEESNPFLKKILLSLKHYRFNKFRKKYFNNQTRKYKSLIDLQNDPPKSDVYIVGSDQTWNPEISKESARAFFLDFGNDNIKRISYASSFGKVIWEDTDWLTQEDTKKLLDNFNSISVRETSAVELCFNSFNIKVEQTIDPVLLKEAYPELIGNSISIKEELVLYKIVNDPNFYNISKEIGQALNLSVRSIGSIRRISGIKGTYPEEIPNWLKSIAEAKYVLTDSFHGVVISLLYKKQFVVIVGNPKLVTRIESLLEILNLKDRIMTSKDSASIIKKKLEEPIDYISVHHLLASLRKKSIDFLLKNLQSC